MFDTLDLADYDTDKPGHYLATYTREFGQLADQPLNLLELGVQRGGSIKLWRDVLPKASIAGLDLNPIDMGFRDDRVRVYQGFQQDPTILAQISTEMAPDGFDVVIDDASHIGRYTAESFWEIFPKYLKPGGVYILDDWDSAYRDDWADGHRYTGDLAAIGVSNEGGAGKPSRIEVARRKVRSAARPIAARLNDRPEIRQRLERAYMKVEGATMRTRLPSHDYGMAGFGKQLVDAVTVDHIVSGSPSRRIIESVTFLPNQIVVRKMP